MCSGLQLIDLNELLDGQPVCQVILSNACAKISLFSFGATLQSFEIDLPGFAKRDVVLGYPDWKTYRRTFDFPSNAYMGHIVGPIAGRVAHATIPWREDSWSFEANEGQHLLHGGKHCFSNHNWKIKATQHQPYPSVTFELQEKEKFNLPGILNCLVTYTLKDTELDIQIESIAIEDTIVNPTQHGYFNPNGHQGSVLDTQTFVFTEKYLELNREKLPSGVLLKTSENRDPNEPLLLSEFEHYPHLDTAFVLNKKQRQARLIAADGFQLQFSTNQPIFQVYIGGQTPFEGKEKTVYRAHSGICLEQQAEPDAPHHPNFNDIYLSKGHSKINSLTIQFEQ
jgi:aldose 1-epimerase